MYTDEIQYVLDHGIWIKKSTSKSLCKRSVASTKSKSCESLHYQYRKIKQGRRTLDSSDIQQ